MQPERRKHIVRERPFTVERLNELYWGESLSEKQIALLASQEHGWRPPVSGQVAHRWLKEAGIRLRTPQEVRQLVRSRPTCQGITKQGGPCADLPKRGYEYCFSHMDQRQLTPEQHKDRAAAGEVLARLEAELGAQIPARVAKGCVEQLRRRVVDTPKIEAVLVETWRNPDLLASRIEYWTERLVERYRQWQQRRERLIDTPLSLAADGGDQG